MYSSQTKKGEASQLENVVSIPSRDLALAEIETFKVRVLALFKEIRTVGIVAYDPQLRTAQEEYLQTLATYRKISQSDFADAKKRAKDMVEASKIKLELLGLNEASIKELEKRKSPDRRLILPDSSMWVYAHFYEYESTHPKVADKVLITSSADPSVIFEGEIKNIEPVLKAKTRTLKVQILVENKNNILRPNMYVDVNLRKRLGMVFAIPKLAVLDTGKRKVAYVDLGEAKFQLREVILGPLAQGYVDGVKGDFFPLIKGVSDGEKVVTKGNFLIDSQSQLGAASSEYGGALASEESTHQHQ